MLSNEQLEEGVLALLCFSNEQAAMIALRITDANIFSNKTNATIAKAALAYVEKYQTPPGVQLEFILERQITRTGEEGKLLAQTLALLNKRSAQFQSEFVITELDRFIDTQKFQASLTHALELSSQGDLEAAREAAYQQISIPTAGTTGIWLNEPSQALSFLNKREDHEFISSGIDFFDDRDIRPARKTLMTLIAASGKGKSWWLTTVGKSAIQFKHKALHITLEMDETKTACRYLQAMFAMTKSEAMTTIRTTRFLQDAGTGALSLDFQSLDRPGIAHSRREIAAKLIAMNPRLLIKEFPTSSLSIAQLALYLDSLEKERHFRPDILIVDYADLMYLKAADIRVDTGRLYKELRGLAVSRDMALVTATQGNRDSENAKIVNSTNISEDWSKVGTSDIVFTYSQTASEKLVNLARLFVAKSRDSEDRFMVLNSQNYQIGQFSLASIQMNSDLANQVSQAIGTE